MRLTASGRLRKSSIAMLPTQAVAPRRQSGRARIAAASVATCSTGSDCDGASDPGDAPNRRLRHEAARVGHETEVQDDLVRSPGAPLVDVEKLLTAGSWFFRKVTLQTDDFKV